MQMFLRIKLEMNKSEKRLEEPLQESDYETESKKPSLLIEKKNKNKTEGDSVV